MQNLILFLIFLFFTSCGVKGKPLPPDKPREMGIGKPQYKGVDQELRDSPEEEDEEKK